MDYWDGETYPVTYTSYTPPKPTVMERATIEENVKNMYGRFIEENTIYIEPRVELKMKQLMAIGGDKEIFGKLVIFPENGILVVKDLLVPYQTVAGATFHSSEEQIGKFEYELMFRGGNINGERMSLDELNELQSHILGHWHSHNSLNIHGTPSPSYTDTSDMMYQREGKPYWIEIISTFGGSSARVTIDKPISILAPIQVKTKWWGSIKKTIDECDGKIFTGFTSYSSPLVNYDTLYDNLGYTVKPNNDLLNKINKFYKNKRIKGNIEPYKNWTKYEAPKLRIDITGKLAKGENIEIPVDNENEKIIKEINERIDEAQKINIIGPSIEYEPIATADPEPIIKDKVIAPQKIDDIYGSKKIVSIRDGAVYAIDWDRRDPIQLPVTVVPPDVQERIAKMFEASILEGERIVIEIDNAKERSTIYWQIYDKLGWVCDLLTRMETNDKEYAIYKKFVLDQLEYAENFEYKYENDNQLIRTDRTITYDYLDYLYIEQQKQTKLGKENVKKYAVNDTVKIIKPVYGRNILSGDVLIIKKIDEVNNKIYLHNTANNIDEILSITELEKHSTVLGKAKPIKEGDRLKALVTYNIGNATFYKDCIYKVDKVGNSIHLISGGNKTVSFYPDNISRYFVSIE